MNLQRFKKLLESSFKAATNHVIISYTQILLKSAAMGFLIASLSFTDW